MRVLDNQWAVCGRGWHADWIRELGLEHDTFTVEQVCRDIKPGYVVIQGGCHLGTLTAGPLKLGATVYGFEPNYDTANACGHNMARVCAESKDPQEMWGRFHLFPKALSSKTGAAHIVRVQDNAGMSYVNDQSHGDPCLTIAIDDLKLEPDLILLDVEGYEVNALLGALETIRLNRPRLILEVNQSALQRAGASDANLIELVEQLGYRWRILQPECKFGDPQYDIEATILVINAI